MLGIQVLPMALQLLSFVMFSCLLDVGGTLGEVGYSNKKGHHLETYRLQSLYMLLLILTLILQTVSSVFTFGAVADSGSSCSCAG